MKNKSILEHIPAFLGIVAVVVSMGGLYYSNEHYEVGTSQYNIMILLYIMAAILNGIYVVNYLSDHKEIKRPYNINLHVGVDIMSLHKFYRFADARKHKRIYRLGKLYYSLQYKNIKDTSISNRWRTKYWHQIGRILEIIHNTEQSDGWYDTVDELVLNVPAYTVSVEYIESIINSMTLNVLIDSNIDRLDPNMQNIFQQHSEMLDKLEKSLSHAAKVQPYFENNPILNK